jgi:phosphatidylglycerol:prolipoprotein diacylglycerol transferase
VIPGVWFTMAALGVLTGLVLQALLVSRAGLGAGPMLALAGIAVLTGFAGAKAWFLVIHLHDHQKNGWCIQGFLTGFAVAVAAGLPLVHAPVGIFLDSSAPGLLAGMAVGRLGCFFAGCCYGRPTASRWGIWSSDQRVGRRRIPTQLIESGLALGVGIAALAVVLAVGPRHSAVFVAALAAYTLCRQGILRLRGKRRQSAIGGPLVVAAAALSLVADGVLLALRPPWLP